MRYIMFLGLTLVATSCFEGKTVKNVQSDKGGASSDDLTSAEMETCLNEGGSVSKEDGNIVCSQSNTSGLCTAKDVDGGIEIACAGKDPVLVKHGNSCEAKLVADGVELKCGTGEPLLIRHGSSCVVEQAEGGANISCPGSSPVFVANGTNGIDGTSCSVTETTDGAIVKCGENGEEVAIKHGSTADGIFATEVVDPCGDYEGFDEILLRLSDGNIVAYFEDGNKNRFLTVLNPEADAGNYVTTDKQKCRFTLHSNGELTW